MDSTMPTLALHFDFSTDPLPGDPDMSRFRYELSRSLEVALKPSGSGRWRGGRYARGVVTLFIDVHDAPSAIGEIQAIMASRGLADRLTIGGDPCLPTAGAPFT
jgi:hypothetical protein